MLLPEKSLSFKSRSRVGAFRPRSYLESWALRSFVGNGLPNFGTFYDELDRAAEGVIGPSQWEAGASFPADIGPDALWFVRNFREQFGRKPEYTAAGSFAMGLIFGECLRHAGSLQDNVLLAAAAELDCYTFYGRFHLDSASGRQVGHRILLVQWRQGHKVLLPAGNTE